MAENSLLRETIGERSISELSQRISNTWPDFKRVAFERQALGNIAQLGLAERIRQVTSALRDSLPEDFSSATDIIIASLGPELQQSSVDGLDLSSPNGFINLPIGDYIAEYGQQHFNLSMLALEQITKRFTAEGAIRRFIQGHKAATFEQLEKWLDHDNVHVRRLVSEGTRPRLPMFSRLPELIKDPSDVFPLLERLRLDNELYVRRSVANHLNDISKDNPEMVVNLLENWSRDASSHTHWLTKHALRTLIKQGNPRALKILGFKPLKGLEITRFDLDKQEIQLGEAIQLSLEIASPSTTESKLLIDYVVYHRKANGKLSPKVFKWSQRSISQQQPVRIEKQHWIKTISTRKYYSGQHEIHLQINGEKLAKRTFMLEI